jgi:hypothetical protein
MGVKAPVTDFQETQFAALRADIAEIRELLRRALPSLQAAPRERLTVAEAAKLALRSEQAITRWCRNHHIGTFNRGRWTVDKAQLKTLLIDRFGAARLPPGLRD